MTVTIDGAKLTIEGVVRVARPSVNGRYEKAALSPKARERIAATRAFIDKEWMNDNAPLMYSF
ncbi:MAG: aromatic amino acid lyase, partial [Alphaproteobacteria bacterium]|nr:aromatic amino acid lyase [Alphaproteobacteria bacterium]